jgi:hypothetical protein
LFHSAFFNVRDANVLRKGVELGRDRVVFVGDPRPVGGKDVVGLAPQEEGVGRLEPVVNDPPKVLVRERDQSAALVKATARVLFGPSRTLHDPIHRQERGHREFHGLLLT